MCDGCARTVLATTNNSRIVTYTYWGKGRELPEGRGIVHKGTHTYQQSPDRFKKSYLNLADLKKHFVSADPVFVFVFCAPLSLFRQKRVSHRG